MVASLVVVMASVAALAALDPQQTSGEAAPLVTVASVAAQDPQLTPDGAALVALVVVNHRQALCWAALVTLVAPATAPSAALDLHRGCLQHRCHLRSRLWFQVVGLHARVYHQ